MVYSRTEGFNPRSNDSFRPQTDKRHHLGHSPLTLIPPKKFNLVYQFPIDYMYCVCLGVMKKMLNVWVERGLDKMEFDARIRVLSISFS